MALFISKVEKHPNLLRNVIAFMNVIWDGEGCPIYILMAAEAFQMAKLLLINNALEVSPYIDSHQHL
jgi:hypothetical protein